MDELLRALADQSRRHIIALVWDEDRTAGALADHFDMSRPAVSQHLKVLHEAGLVSVRVDGTRRYYRAVPQRLNSVRAMLEEFWDDKLRLLKLAAEDAQRKLEAKR